MRKFVLAVVLVLMAGGAQAVTLTVIGGQLMGASNVLVDGNLYDVEFLDGSCIVLYNGCDDIPSDFTFQTEASALLASQALLDQVFLDGVQGQFDLEPELTNGCTSPISCTSYTPFGGGLLEVPPPSSSIFFVHEAGAANLLPAGTDSLVVTYASFYPARDLSSLPDAVYAVWSTVPEPSTALLLGLGLTGLAAKGRRRS